jgi:hypothetical protein
MSWKGRICLDDFDGGRSFFAVFQGEGGED